MTAARADPSLPDFSTLDFERLWQGRAKTTAVESRVLASALRATNPARVLEVGCGDGRLTPTARAAASEYVALDATRSFVGRLDPRWVSPPAGLRAIANLYRLPFVERSFSCLVMARVYNFLADPAAALRECVRVLVPGGHLIVSYEPKPSLGTLAGDLRTALARKERPFRTQTFSDVDVVPVHPSSFPAWAPTRRRFASTLREAQLRLDREFGTGLEDYLPFRWLPAAVFPALSEAFGSSVDGLFPSRWVLASTTSSGGPEIRLPPLAEVLACPRCDTAVGPVDFGNEWVRPCPGCGFEVRFGSGILEALSPGVRDRR